MSEFFELGYSVKHNRNSVIFHKSSGFKIWDAKEFIENYGLPFMTVHNGVRQECIVAQFPNGNPQICAWPNEFEDRLLKRQPTAPRREESHA